MSKLQQDSRSNVAQALTLGGTLQCVTVGAASAQSAALGAGTTLVELVASTNSWVAYGANPTAQAHTAWSKYLAAGVPYVYGVTPGNKFAVIEDSTGGYLSILECA
jgi:hypothetical protein